jgi:hypothetical protein
MTWLECKECRLVFPQARLAAQFRGWNKGATGPDWRSSKGGPCKWTIHASDQCTHTSTHYTTITDYPFAWHSISLYVTSEGGAKATKNT